MIELNSSIGATPPIETPATATSQEQSSEDIAKLIEAKEQAAIPVAPVVTDEAVKEAILKAVPAETPATPPETAQVQETKPPESEVDRLRKELETERKRYGDSTREFQRLQGQLRELQEAITAKQQPETEVWTEEKLDRVIAEQPEYAPWAYQEKAKLLEKKIEERVMSNIQRRQEAMTATQQAYTEFPELRDSNSDLYKLAAMEFTRIYGKLPVESRPPDAIYNAAVIAKAKLTPVATVPASTPQTPTVQPQTTANKPPFVPQGGGSGAPRSAIPTEPSQIGKLSAEELKKIITSVRPETDY